MRCHNHSRPLDLFSFLQNVELTLPNSVELLMHHLFRAEQIFVASAEHFEPSIALRKP